MPISTMRAVHRRREWRRIGRGTLEAVMPGPCRGRFRQTGERSSPRTFRRGGWGWRYRSVGRRKGACRLGSNLRASLAARRAAASPDQTERSSSSQTACMERSPTGQARQRRGIGTCRRYQGRPEPARRPVPEWSCRSTPRRGQAIAGSPPQALRPPSARVSSADEGGRNPLKRARDLGLGAGFTDSRTQRFKHRG
jgi:hypothetical protein